MTIDLPGRAALDPGRTGAIQVAGGQLIVLGVACGTMGGYPHVAHVISADLDRLGQLKPGDGITFRMVTLDQRGRLTMPHARSRRGAATNRDAGRGCVMHLGRTDHPQGQLSAAFLCVPLDQVRLTALCIDLNC